MDRWELIDRGRRLSGQLAPEEQWDAVREVATGELMGRAYADADYKVFTALAHAQNLHRFSDSISRARHEYLLTHRRDDLSGIPC